MAHSKTEIWSAKEEITLFLETEKGTDASYDSH